MLLGWGALTRIQGRLSPRRGKQRHNGPEILITSISLGYVHICAVLIKRRSQRKRIPNVVASPDTLPPPEPMPEPADAHFSDASAAMRACRSAARCQPAQSSQCKRGKGKERETEITYDDAKQFFEP